MRGDDAFERGFEEVDFLGDTEPWKLEWTTTTRPHDWLFVFSKSSRGRLPVRVPGVWGIAFGAGGMSGRRTTLFYAAGPHRWHGASEVDVHGVLGSITPG